MPISRRQVLAASLATPLVASRAFAWQEPAKSQGTTWQEQTAQSEKAIRRGADWMLKTMNRDGGCGVDIGQPPDIGCSSMVGLALLSMGNTPIEGLRAQEVRQIISYLLRVIENMPADDITSVTGTQLQNKIGRHAHSFFAATFLSQVLGEGYDIEPVRVALKRVVTAIVNSQAASGNWGDQSWAPMLGTVMGWVSLRAADAVGLKVGKSPETTANHIIQTMGSTLNEGSWMHTLYKNATGVRVLFAMGRDNEDVAKRAFKGVEDLVKRDNTAFSQAGGEEYLAFHLITETMLQKGGEDWKAWFPVIRDKIIAVQNSDGSWTGHHCITSRTFCTAAAILVLSSPNRYLPISQL